LAKVSWLFLAFYVKCSFKKKPVSIFKMSIWHFTKKIVIRVQVVGNGKKTN
jgi:hypothetical protein